MVDWKVADSLLQLRDQLNEAAPLRSKKSDGFIGDSNHQNRTSDHNPWWDYKVQYYVTAGDFTHDPAHGLDCNRLWHALLLARDPRIKYIIWDGYIVDARWVMRNGKNHPPYTVFDYTGPNPHKAHLHLSVLPDPISLNTLPWLLPGFTPTEDELPSVEDVWGRQVFDYYTNNPNDTMRADIALAYATANVGRALDTALRVEKKLDELIAKLAAQ